jgi:hypothetical protein
MEISANFGRDWKTQKFVGIACLPEWDSLVQKAVVLFVRCEG